MGQFSFVTQDGGQTIFTADTRPYAETYYMKDDKGNIWEEESYEGYGEFGGKDFYVLLAEMNGFSLEDFAGFKDPMFELRAQGIDLAFDEDATNILWPNILSNENSPWRNEEPEQAPNQGWYEGDGSEYEETF